MVLAMLPIRGNWIERTHKKLELMLLGLPFALRCLQTSTPEGRTATVALPSARCSVLRLAYLKYRQRLR